jgi:hypothetical protein
MRFRIVSVLGIAVAIAAWVALSAASPIHTGHTNRSHAIAVADQMLDLVVLPAGATRISAAPKIAGNFLDGPFMRYLIVSQVDRSRFWTVPAPPNAVMASFEAHLPKGAKAAEATSGGSEFQAAYSLPTVQPRTLGARQLVLAAVARSSGGTIVRADAEIRYVAPRPYNERIPAAAHVLDITVGSNLSRPLLSLTVTKTAEVSRIARIANGLPFAGNQEGLAYSCPSVGPGSPVDSFIFRSSRAGPVLASVTELASELSVDDPCSRTLLTIRGHHEPGLQDGGILIRQAGALLHDKLSR